MWALETRGKEIKWFDNRHIDEIDNLDIDNLFGIIVNKGINGNSLFSKHWYTLRPIYKNKVKMVIHETKLRPTISSSSEENKNVINSTNSNNSDINKTKDNIVVNNNSIYIKDDNNIDNSEISNNICINNSNNNNNNNNDKKNTKDNNTENNNNKCNNNSNNCNNGNSGTNSSSSNSNDKNNVDNNSININYVNNNNKNNNNNASSSLLPIIPPSCLTTTTLTKTNIAVGLNNNNFEINEGIIPINNSMIDVEEEEEDNLFPWWNLDSKLDVPVQFFTQEDFLFHLKCQIVNNAQIILIYNKSNDTKPDDN